MKKINPNFKIVGLFFLLLIIPFIPLVITQQYNNAGIDKLYTSDFQMIEEHSSVESEATLSTLEKLAVIVELLYEDNGIITETEYKEIPIELGNGMKDKLTHELKLLMELNAIPEIELSSDYTISRLSKTKIVNHNDKQKRASFWDMEINLSGNDIRVWMDTDTDIVYRLSISDIFDESGDKKYTLAYNFISYLGFEEKDRVTDSSLYGGDYYELNTEQVYCIYRVIFDDYYLCYDLVNPNLMPK